MANIKYYKGTVFNVSNVDAIVNTINCVGTMGAGIALEYKLRYPQMYNSYKVSCDKGLIRTGSVYYYKENNVTIINFPTKRHFKYPSKIEWIESALIHFKNTYANYNIKSVAFPKLGTNNGGLDWCTIKTLMEKHLDIPSLNVYICLDELTYAEGRERQMVDAFNKTNIKTLKENGIRLSKNQISSLESVKPLQRFWKLSTVQGIGCKTYENLYHYFYCSYYEQLTLVDF